MPQVWLARFGCSVAEQVVDAVRDRLRGPSAAGMQVTVAGRRIAGAGAEPEDEEARKKALEEAEAKQKLATLTAWQRGGTDEQAQDRRAGYGTERA